MPANPETSLALAAAVLRLATWTGAAVPPSPAAVVTIARRLEIAAHAQVEHAVRRVREKGQGWAVIASLLGLDALPCHVADPARLAFDYCTGRPAAGFGSAPVLVGLPCLWADHRRPRPGRYSRLQPTGTCRRMRAPGGRRRRVGRRAPR
jgi:hypothetical protein